MRGFLLSAVTLWRRELVRFRAATKSGFGRLGNPTVILGSSWDRESGLLSDCPLTPTHWTISSIFTLVP